VSFFFFFALLYSHLSLLELAMLVNVSNRSYIVKDLYANMHQHNVATIP